MNKKIAMVKTINGEATVTVETAESREQMNLKNGACLVVVAGSDDEVEVVDPKPSDEPEPDDDPAPTHEPEPIDEPTPTDEPNPGDDESDGRLTFFKLVDRFNEVLQVRGYNQITIDKNVYHYLAWANSYAKRMYDEQSWPFKKDLYPLLYDYRGGNTDTLATGYNAMVAMLMAMQLMELVPDAGPDDNTQTQLAKLAYNIGGGSQFPLYNDKALRADPYAMRDAASVMYAICRSAYNNDTIDGFRDELGGKMIQADDWSGMGYENEMLTDEYGRRGYKTTFLGYAINTRMFLLDSPGPRVEGTTACDLPLPQLQGQPETLFNRLTGNYLMDERIYDYFVDNYNMMSQTPIEEWERYDDTKKQRMVNVAAIPPCTLNYMFGKHFVTFDGLKHKTYDGSTYAYYYTFSESASETPLSLDGPFSDLQGMYRYNAAEKNAREKFLDVVTDFADNMRFPTQDPNYGRCRPGCRNSRQGGERNPIHGSADNEVYNIDLCAIVADNEAMREKMIHEDGFAADSPRSYVSGHSAQIWALALMLTQMDSDETVRPLNWLRKAYEYSVNRSVGRFHWNSDCVYGRMFGALTLPILNAMTGTRDGFKTTASFVKNPKPEPSADAVIDLVIRNLSDADVTLNGEMCLVLANPDRNGKMYGWDGPYNRTGHIRFSGPVTINAGESMAFGDVCCENSEIAVRGRNLVDESRIPETGRPSNVLLYDTDGVSETFVPQPADSSLIFEDNAELILTII